MKRALSVTEQRLADQQPLTTEQFARRIYAAALKAGVLNEIRQWDKRVWKDGDWECQAPGLTDFEKAKWMKVASDLARSAMTVRATP